MKTIGVRVGAPVAIVADTSTIVCQAWPSKTLTAGSASMHRIWWPNFMNQTNVKRIHAVSSAMDKFHLVPCHHAVFSIVSADLSSKITTTHKDNDSSLTGMHAINLLRSEVFQSYLLASLMDVPLSVGQVFGLSWKTKPIVLTLESVVSDPSLEAQTLLPTKHSNKILHVISTHTKMTLSSSSLSSAIPTVLLPHAPSYPQSNHSNQNYQLYEMTHPNFMKEFGGYTQQVHESLTTILAGLGMVNLPNVLHPPASVSLPATDETRPPLTITESIASNTKASTNDSSGCDDGGGYDALFPHLLNELLQPPKGLLIHGPPGTGKSKLMHSLAEVVQAMVMVDDTATTAATAAAATTNATTNATTATTAAAATAAARSISPNENNDHNQLHTGIQHTCVSPPIEGVSRASSQRAVHVPVHVLEISHAMLLGKYEGNLILSIT